MNKKLLFRLVALVVAMMCALGASAAEAYANYTPSDSTLTFYYDNLRSSRTGATYDLNTGDNTPGWDTDGTYAKVTKVVFNSSFADARPTSTSKWFSAMAKLKSITGLNYLNTSNVTNMSDMFLGCKKITSLDLSNFNTSKVTNMSYMFGDCYDLTSLNLSSFNTSNVTRMGYMFYRSSLTSLDLSSFNTSNVTNMDYMFSLSYLITIYAGSGWNTDAVTSSYGMFSYCRDLVGGQGTTYNSSHTDKAYAHIDGGPSNPGYLTALTLDNVLNYEGGNIHFNSSGDYPWMVVTEGYRTFAQSSNAGIPSSTSTLTATVTVDKATTLSFEYKAWGEGADVGQGSYYDKCSFSVDGVEKFACGKRDNDWEVYSIELSAGTHMLEWSYAKDSSVNPVGDYYAVDNVVIGKPLLNELDRALNIEGGEIHFVTTGDYPWVLLTDGSRRYAQSSNAGIHSSTSTLTATVFTNNGGTLSFEYKAWGEGVSYDKCIFSVDGVAQFTYGAIKNDWEIYTVELTAGTHNLEWSYTKDVSVNPEGDYFAVDNVALEEVAVMRGDVNCSGNVDISDVSALIDYLLIGDANGINMSAADCDQSGDVDISDVSTLIDYLLMGSW